MNKAGFIHDRKGVTAVEFSLLAVPFFWLLFTIIELALYFTTDSLMAEATNVGARMVRTGQLEGAGDPESAFRQAVCDRVAIFIPCGDIQFQVQVIPSGNFGDAATATFDAGGNLNGQGYQDGEQSNIMLVRLAYPYPFLTPLVGDVLANGPNNTRLIMNTIVMRNEPYEI